MKKSANSPDSIKERIPKAFKSKLPLVAGLSASLVLFPGGCFSTAHGANENVKGNAAIEQKEGGTQSVTQKNPWVDALVKNLTGSDMKAAVEAAKTLSKMGGNAIPKIVQLLDSDLKNSEAHKRALAVLHSMKWEKIGTVEKRLAVVKMFPLLLRFDRNGRTQESLLAGSTMIKIGDLAIPAFCALIRSDIKIVRLLGMDALMQVEWKKITPKNAFDARDLLMKIKETDGMEMFHQMAREIIRSIDRMYQRCGLNPELETQNIKRNLDGVAYEKKAA